MVNFQMRNKQTLQDHRNPGYWCYSLSYSVAQIHVSLQSTRDPCTVQWLTVQSNWLYYTTSVVLSQDQASVSCNFAKFILHNLTSLKWFDHCIECLQYWTLWGMRRVTSFSYLHFKRDSSIDLRFKRFLTNNENDYLWTFEMVREPGSVGLL